jgi:hypothetical protein
LGLTTGPVPARVDAPVKQGLLALVDHRGRAWLVVGPSVPAAAG